MKAQRKAVPGERGAIVLAWCGPVLGRCSERRARFKLVRVAVSRGRQAWRPNPACSGRGYAPRQPARQKFRVAFALRLFGRYAPTMAPSLGGLTVKPRISMFRMDTKPSQRNSGVISGQVLGSLALYTFFVAVSLFVMINVHEIGHTLFARLFGDTGAFYALYKLHPDGSVACIGCNVYDETKLSFIGNVVVTLGGVIFSQGLAVVLLWYKGKTKMGETSRRFCGVLTTVCVFDAVFQVAQSITANTVHQSAFTRVDIADFVWLVANQAHVSHVVVKGIVLVVLLVYLWWFIGLYRKTSVVDAH